MLAEKFISQCRLAEFTRIRLVLSAFSGSVSWVSHHRAHFSGQPGNLLHSDLGSWSSCCPLTFIFFTLHFWLLYIMDPITHLLESLGHSYFLGLGEHLCRLEGYRLQLQPVCSEFKYFKNKVLMFLPACIYCSVPPNICLSYFCPVFILVFWGKTCSASSYCRYQESHPAKMAIGHPSFDLVRLIWVEALENYHFQFSQTEMRLGLGSGCTNSSGVSLTLCNPQWQRMPPSDCFYDIKDNKLYTWEFSHVFWMKLPEMQLNWNGGPGNGSVKSETSSLLSSILLKPWNYRHLSSIWQLFVAFTSKSSPLFRGLWTFQLNIFLYLWGA